MLGQSWHAVPYIWLLSPAPWLSCSGPCQPQSGHSTCPAAVAPAHTVGRMWSLACCSNLQSLECFARV